MAPTRRTLLKTVGAAAVAGKLLKAGGAKAAQGPQGGASLRGYTYCNLRSGLGVKQGDRILDVAAGGKQLKVAVPANTDEVIAGKHSDGLLKVIQAAPKNATIAESEAKFAPCITDPEKIIMLGFNYKKHVMEVKVPMPTAPVLFNKYNNSLLAHHGTIRLPTKVAQNIAYASSIFTLKPGDIFSTGTPEGVILGKPEAEQVWLKAGDKVACSVEKLGELSFNLA